MEESGFELVETGDWEDIIAFFDRISRAMDDCAVDGRDRFEEWRPKAGEDRAAVRGRTVDGESIGTTRFEEESDGTRTELSRAGGEMRDSGAELVHGRPRESMKKAEDAGRSTGRGLVPMLARLVRGVERGIYRHIVEPTNPDYFEAGDLSASIEKRGVWNRQYRGRVIFSRESVMDSVLEEIDE
ncbi:MAG: DUF5828 family protein [Candidatus Nanohaloarchaea archaeon]|nr:DUF5828 family protein [Candidatus Nanohaloarchaea archaeon]